jgi:hypothetical protein
MVSIPAAIPVTTPVLVTVAKAGNTELQVAVVPAAGGKLTFSAMVFEAPIHTLVGPVIVGTATGDKTFITNVLVSGVAAQPYNVAVIVVLAPGARAVAMAVAGPDTAAETIKGADELHVE